MIIWDEDMTVANGQRNAPYVRISGLRIPRSLAFINYWMSDMSTKNSDSVGLSAKEHYIGLDKSQFLRLAPLLALAYILYFVARTIGTYENWNIAINVGTPVGGYALGAGLVFVSYARVRFFSKLITHRAAVCLCLAVVMILWVLLSNGVAFVMGETSLFFVNLLLGAAGALILAFAVEYLANCFERTERTCAASYFLLGVFAVYILGNPVGRSFVGLNGGQDWLTLLWVLVLEGLPYATMVYAVSRRLRMRSLSSSWASHSERAIGNKSGSESKPALDMMSGSGSQEKYSRYRNITIDEAFGERV